MLDPEPVYFQFHFKHFIFNQNVPITLLMASYCFIYTTYYFVRTTLLSRAHDLVFRAQDLIKKSSRVTKGAP